MRRFFGPTGSVSRITVESCALENNMLDDPSVRAVDIYLPAGRARRTSVVLPLMTGARFKQNNGLRLPLIPESPCPRCH